MKRVLALLVSLAVLLFLAGCGGGSGDSGKTNTLTVWYWGEQEVPGYQGYMEEMARKYGEANNITVEVVLQESDNLVSAFRTAEGAGEAPDLAFLWGGTLALEDAWLGNLVPVSDYLTREQLSVMDPYALQETYWNGKQWCFPAYSVVFGVAYNKEMMAAAGVDPENPYTSWEEFIGVCEKLKAAGYTPLGGGLKDGYLPGWLAFYYGQQNYNNKQESIEAFKLNQSYTDPQCSEWLVKLKELIDKDYYNDDIQSLDFYQGQQLLENKQAAMTFHVHGYATTLAEKMGNNVIGFAMQPVYGSGKLAQSVVIQSQVFIMPKSAKNKEEGAKFLMFLQEEANLKELYDRTKAKVPNINFKNEWLSSEVDKKVASFLDQYPGFCYQYVYPANFEYEGLVPTVQRMFAEGLSAEAAARDLDAAIKKLAEQSPDQVEAYEIWEE